MGCADAARDRLRQMVRDAGSPAERDRLLDVLWDYENRATEWDAERWGFSPGRWMRRERDELSARGGQDWPVEPMMRVPS
jgi:hypothetical protein